jgi:hypothetical protein
VTLPLDDRHVPAILAAFDLGSWGRLSDGPVASGRLGSFWRLDAERGSWAIKQVGDVPDQELAELLEGAAFQEAALAAGVPAPAVRRTRAGAHIADCGGVRVRLHAWVDLHDPDVDLDPLDVGRLVAGLHRVDFAGATGLDPWYTAPVGVARWSELVRLLRARHAPFADELEALVPELVAMEAHLTAPPRELRTCHRDLWPRRVRHGGPAAGDHPRRVRGGGRARARRGPGGLRDADRAALAHRRRGLPALADGHDRRRTERQRRLGPRVRRPTADPNRDRGAPGR